MPQPDDIGWGVALDSTFVKRRLRGPKPIVAADRRLVAITTGTYKRLEVLAEEISKVVGFVVWPCQVAALIVEQNVR